MTPQEIERYVLLASDASNIELQQKANIFLNQWVTTNNDKVLADAIIEVVRVTQREVVLFYALTVFSRLNNADPRQRSVFRQEILTQLFQSSSSSPPPTSPSSYIATDNNTNVINSTTSSSNNYHNRSSWSPTYLRTKVGVLLARFIQLDFPHAWPSTFDDLQAPQMLQNAPDILLRTLISLMDDFGRDETEINTKVKDYLRGYDTNLKQPNQVMVTNNPQQSISGRLIETISSILEQALSESNGRTKEQKQVYAILSLQALKGFMSWVDIVLLLDERILRLIFVALARGSAVDAANAADAGVVAIECIEELVDRGMEDDKKIKMLSHTRVLENIHAHVDLVTVDASPIDVVLEVAKFINRTGLEVLPIIFSAEQQQQHRQVFVAIPDDFVTLKNQLVDIFFRCFAYDDIDVSGAVIPLAGSLISISSLDRQQQQTKFQQQKSLLPNLLNIAYNQMRYPLEFQYDYEDEDEAEEEIYRTELRKLNQKFVRANSELCLQTLSTILSHLPLPLSTAPTPDIEVAVSLVYQYCEGIRPPPGMKVVMRDETFCSLLVGLHLSDIIQHPHREVLTLYYETSVRYYPLLKERSDLLQKVLEGMTGTRGLQHEYARVRSRCCYLLLRLIKSVGSNSNKSNQNSVLRPYVETAVSGIQGLLENDNVQLRLEDTLNLFETIGLLLGKNGLTPSEQGQYLTNVMAPHVRSIEIILNEKKQYIAQDSDKYGEKLSNSIAAIAYLSKGFKRPSLEVQTVLMGTLQVALTVLEAFPTNYEVRNKTYVFIQRLIQCLENKVLNIMPRLLSLLIQHCTAEDILDVSQLINQLCIKFRTNAACVLDSNLLPFLQKCYHISNTIAIDKSASEHQQGQDRLEVAPHLRTEQLSIQKLSYAVLNHIVSNNVSAVLLSPTNVSSLEAILQSMSEGAISVEDPLMKKTCLVFFRLLLDQTVGNGRSNLSAPDYVVQGFVQFICDVLVPGILQSFLRNDGVFNVNDANYMRLLVEFSAILEILKTRLPGNVVANTIFQFEGFRLASNRNEFEHCLKNLIQKNIAKHKSTPR